MRTTSKLITGILALALLSACSNDEMNERGNEEKASITITLKGENLSSKATGSTSDTETDERKIVNYKVYVFSYNSGVLEKEVDGAVNNGIAGSTQVDGLSTAGTKRVVVVANLPARFPAVSNYTDFETATFDLGLQNPANRATTGLVMSGESPELTLTSGSPVPVTVSIRRVVAKIELGSVTITPEAGHTEPFVLTHVSIQKAKSKATIGPNTVLSEIPFYGGFGGTESNIPTPDNYLLGAITTDQPNGTAKSFDNFFYVFPNEETGAETLLTISGTYKGSTTHFPFRINSIVSSTADGTLIKRNTRYILNVTLKKLGSGTTDPDGPGDPAAVEVTVTTEGWEDPLEQDVEW